jgi:5'(3')-deoxyribonucleotidase
MVKKSIGIDLDSTLNNLDTVWLEVYNKEYNDNLTVKDLTSWDIASIVKPECGQKMFDYLLEPGFFKNLGIQPNAYEVTKWLSEQFDLYIVTAYHHKTCADKAEWVEKYLPHIPTRNIIFCNHKGLIKTNMLIDDGGHNILDFSESNKFGTPILFDAPWNQHLGNNFIRAKDWLEIREVIEELICNGSY